MSFDLSPLRRAVVALAVLLTTTLPLSEAASASPCPGDCNADATTNINELVLCVNVALGSNDVSSCASCDQNADGHVLINELITAVRRALDSCRPDFAQAAVGVLQADPLASLTIIDLGYAGSTHSAAPGPHLRGAALRAGTPGCILCNTAAQVTAYDCSESGGVSTLTATLDHCSDDLATRTGQIHLTVADADFCSSCEIPRDVPATQQLTAYSETRDGETLAIPDMLTESFTLGDDGCRVGVDGAIADRRTTYTGALHVTGNGRDVTYTYDHFDSALQSSRDAGQLCSVSNTQNGTVHVEDVAANRRFTQTAEDLVVVDTERSGGGHTVTINTLPGGRLLVDCFGGAVTLETVTPLLLPSDEGCPTDGLLEVTFADLPAPNVSALQFTGTGGVAVDVAFDGTFAADDTFTSCQDSTLSQCSAELPPQSPPPTRTPTVTPTPPLPTNTATATRTAPIATATRTAAATLTATAVIPPTSTGTATQTSTPVNTATATATALPVCNTILPAGLVTGQTWTAANSPYCITGDLSVSLLTIQAGVEVLIDGPYEINVISTITATGGAAAPIRFAPRNRQVPWKGIRFQNTPEGSSFSYCRFESSNRSALTLTEAVGMPISHCEFTSNTNAGPGGAINAVHVNGVLEISASHFSSNSATNGGAIHALMNPNAALTILGSLFDGNVANPTYANGNYVGGALYLEDGTGVVLQSQFLGNHSNSACNGAPSSCDVQAAGGAVYVGGSGALALRSSLMVGNETDAFNNGDCLLGGSSISGGSGLWANSANVFVENTIFACNFATQSGSGCGPQSIGTGLFVNGGTTAVNNVTIARNGAGTGLGYGGGVLDVTSSILFFNNNGGEQISGQPSISYSDIQGGYSGSGNINLDPVFASSGCAAGDLRIALGSPGIDKGHPDMVYSDTCFPPSLGGQRNDMGAFGGPGACNVPLP